MIQLGYNYNSGHRQYSAEWSLPVLYPMDIIKAVVAIGKSTSQNSHINSKEL